MPAHRLELEITESQLMDNAHAAEQQLAALKALGVQLAIDDFWHRGTPAWPTSSASTSTASR